jgi:hypothetical protein
MFRRPNSPFPSPVKFACYQMTLLVGFQSALMDESGVFLCRYHSTMVLDAHVSPGPLVAAVQRPHRHGHDHHHIITSFIIYHSTQRLVSRGSSGSIVSGYGLDDRAIEVRFPGESKRSFL